MPHNWTAISGRIYEYRCKNCGYKIDSSGGTPDPEVMVEVSNRIIRSMAYLKCEEYIAWQTHAS